jgi:hypothetical protein
MKRRLLISTLALLLFFGAGSVATTIVSAQNCACGCVWNCTDNRCQFYCDQCTILEEVMASGACCDGAKRITDCGLE